MAKGKKLFCGLAGGAPVTAVGTVRVVNGDEAKIAQVTQGEILVANKLEPQATSMSTPEFDSHMHRAIAYIQNTGGFTNHVNMLAKEHGKASVSGTMGISQVEATEVLKDGQKIVVEGYTEELPGKKADGTAYMRKIGCVYEWVPGPDEPGVSAPAPAPAPKPAAGAFDMAAFLKSHGLKPKGS